MSAPRDAGQALAVALAVSLAAAERHPHARVERRFPAPPPDAMHALTSVTTAEVTRGSRLGRRSARAALGAGWAETPAYAAVVSLGARLHTADPMRLVVLDLPPVRLGPRLSVALWLWPESAATTSVQLLLLTRGRRSRTARIAADPFRRVSTAWLDAVDTRLATRPTKGAPA